jgi:hypothetical protein
MRNVMNKTRFNFGLGSSHKNVVFEHGEYYLQKKLDGNGSADSPLRRRRRRRRRRWFIPVKVV